MGLGGTSSPPASRVSADVQRTPARRQECHAEPGSGCRQARLGRGRVQLPVQAPISMAAAVGGECPPAEARPAVFGDAAPSGGPVPGPTGSAPRSGVRLEGTAWNQKQVPRPCVSSVPLFPPVPSHMALSGMAGSVRVSDATRDRPVAHQVGAPLGTRRGSVPICTHSALQLAGKHTYMCRHKRVRSALGCHAHSATLALSARPL